MSNKSELSDTIEVRLGGETREIFMSYALLDELLRLLRDLPDVNNAAVDPEMREKVLVAVFSERDAKGKIKNPIEPASLPITAKEVLRIFRWVQDHVLDFLFGAVQATVSAMEPHSDKLGIPSTPSGSGSPN